MDLERQACFCGSVVLQLFSNFLFSLAAVVVEDYFYTKHMTELYQQPVDIQYSYYMDIKSLFSKDVRNNRGTYTKWIR